MKKIALLILVTSSLIADVPGAGRPDPGAFVEENTKLLSNIDIRLNDLAFQIRQLTKFQEELEMPVYNADSIDKKIQALIVEISFVKLKMEYLIWLLDHRLDEESFISEHP